MKIGVVPFLDKSGGGIYQYSSTFLQQLAKLKKEGGNDEFIIFAQNIYHPSLESLKRNSFKVVPLEPFSFKEKIKHILKGFLKEELILEFHNRLYKKRRITNLEKINYRHDLKSWFRSHQIDLMLYPAPMTISFEAGIPYLMSIHDLQHRLQPEFPEVSCAGEWEQREYLYRNGAKHATLLLADSETGKEDILNSYGRYGVVVEIVKVLPYLPTYHSNLDNLEKERKKVSRLYHLPRSYLFYPAQFWPHKNHLRIIKALGLLKKEKHLDVPVVFCGQNIGEMRRRTFNEALSLSFRLDINKNVFYLGYVEEKNMFGLYAGATALVMPTFFGPTNIPILEAWSFGCPVVTSDIRGIREQVGNAALLVNPRSVRAINEGICNVWINEDLRRILIKRGRERLSLYTEEDYRDRLKKIIELAKWKLSRK